MPENEEFRPLAPPPRGQLPLSLALQGGGSFGAFTWGVLDRLLEEPTIGLDMVSGASAGAVNAVLLAGGMQQGGRDGARAALERFWAGVGRANPMALLGFAAPAAAALRLSGQIGLAHLGLTLAGRPSAFNPLRDLLENIVDFPRLRAGSPLRLLIAATRVRDGRLRLFREHEITVDMVLASACLPNVTKAVVIDGEAYWDGGLSANPPLRQVVRDTAARDIVLVQIMPEARTDIPDRSNDVVRRLGELAFTTPLQREIEAIADLREICRSVGSDPCRKLQALRFHRIAAEDLVDDLTEQSAMDTDWALLTQLHEKGREAAAGWLAQTMAPV